MISVSLSLTFHFATKIGSLSLSSDYACTGRYPVQARFMFLNEFSISLYLSVSFYLCLSLSVSLSLCACLSIFYVGPNGLHPTYIAMYILINQEPYFDTSLSFTHFLTKIGFDSFGRRCSGRGKFKQS